MMKDSRRGTFGDDLNFLKKYGKVVVLKSPGGEAQLIVSPGLQGKVMTSTAAGEEGKSFGWINYELIASGKFADHINAYGGEDRLWLGPEGGQFSVFFAAGAEMTLENWFTPKGIDTEPFQLVSASDTEVVMQTALTLTNYSNTQFQAALERRVKLLDNSMITQRLQIDPSELKSVAYESQNILKNAGQNSWTKESGTLCIWILGMFTPSEEATVIVPFLTGPENQLGQVVTSDYFGEIPQDRLQVRDGCIFFKADGKFRSKIGIAPKRAKDIAGSYDPINSVLTLIQYTKPAGDPAYINQLWEIQEHPFQGDVLNSYNDGPLPDGTQMGPFYELESSSPAALLAPGEQIEHRHTTYHFVGSKKNLNNISLKTLGVDLDTVSEIFK